MGSSIGRPFGGAASSFGRVYVPSVRGEVQSVSVAARPSRHAKVAGLPRLTSCRSPGRVSIDKRSYPDLAPPPRADPPFPGLSVSSVSGLQLKPRSCSPARF